MGQQAIVINTMPTPGSEAWRTRQAKLKAKGKLTDEEVAEIDRVEGKTDSQGQRVMTTLPIVKAPASGNRLLYPTAS